MPTVVHIADAKLSKKITTNGIAPGKKLRAVYFMPVTQNHFVSHQWLRELRRNGARTYAGIYFRMPSDEKVWAGKYNAPHRELKLGEAIGDLLKLPDPLGYEMFIQRKILPREITRVRQLPQTIGWRYMPYAHGRPLCGCPVCIPKGSIKGRALRSRIEPPPAQPSYDELKATLRNSHDCDEILTALCWLRSKRCRVDPMFLERILDFEDAYLLEELVSSIACFRHKNSVLLLTRLSVSNYMDVREAAKLALQQFDGAQLTGTRS